MSEHKWMSSGFLRAAPTGTIDPQKGVIEGVSVCTVGEAKGHGVNLDSEFIADVAKMGNEKRQGLKARYGHPNMCGTALGTFLGRFKHFSVDGDQVRADLFLSNEARETPQGDLHSYVMGMAANEPDMFGTSIVFTPGRSYKRTKAGKKIYHPGWSADEDETGEEHKKRREEWNTTPGPLYVECESLHACDAVDEPAANDGLFSRFGQETIAGQITEFLDLNPQVWDAIQSNPSILEALARYGDKVDEFTARYRAYREHSKEDTMSKEKVQAESGTEAEAAPLAATEAEELEATEEAETVGAAETEAAELAADEEAETTATTSSSEFEEAEADALRAQLSAAEADKAHAMERAGTAETELAASVVALSEMTEALTTATAELEELRQRLAAIEKGAPPLSAAPAPADGDKTPWQKAQKK
jgi:hypothetical protein